MQRDKDHIAGQILKIRAQEFSVEKTIERYHALFPTLNLLPLIATGFAEQLSPSEMNEKILAAVKQHKEDVYHFFSEAMDRVDFTDPLLTELHNLRGFKIHAKRELLKHPYSGVAIVDLDGFKQVNDTLGHPAGNQVLEMIKETLLACICRKGDLKARVGGDEFACLFSNRVNSNKRAYASAHKAAERVLQGISAIEIGEHPQKIKITASIGVTIPRYPGEDIASIMERADGALYKAKHEGKNRIMFA